MTFDDLRQRIHEAQPIHETGHIDGAISDLEADFDAMRETITRQHAILWQIGLDDHEEEDPISDEEAMEHFLALRAQIPEHLS